MQSPNRSPKAIAKAKRLRRESTVSESVLWNWIRNKRLGAKFRRQHAIAPYTLDFYCVEAKLCVEVDGPQHAQHIDRDQVRDKALRQLGILTIRIPSIDLFDPKGIATLRHLESIAYALEQRLGRPMYRPWSDW